MSAKALLDDYFRVVWTEGRVDEIERFIAPHAAVAGLLPAVPLGPQDIRVLAEALGALVRRPRFAVQHLIEEGDWAAAVIAMQGTVIATGREARCEGQILFHHEGGRVIRAHNSLDMLDLFTRIGAVPPDALPRLLSGERLAWQA